MMALVRVPTPRRVAIRRLRFNAVRAMSSAETKESTTFIIGLAIALLVLTLVGGLGFYILSTFNQSGVTIPKTVNFFGNNISLLNVVVVLLIVSAIVAVAVLIIQKLRSTAETV